MRGNYRRAWMIVMVFLVSIMSPLTIDNEPVEAHFEAATEPPIRVKVYLNHVYSTRDLDDGGLFWLGGDAELSFLSEVEHVGHEKSVYPQEIEWNMDQDDGTGILWWDTDERVEITRSPCWVTEDPGTLDSDCDHIADTQDGDDDNDEILDEDDEYPNDPENNGKVGRQEMVWNLPFEPRKLLYDHNECTPETEVLFTFDVRTLGVLDWWWYAGMVASILAITALMIIPGTQGVGAVWATGLAATSAAVGATVSTVQLWKAFDDDGHYLQPRVYGHKLEIGDNIIFPPDGGTANQGGPIGVNVTLEIEPLNNENPEMTEQQREESTYRHRPCVDTSQPSDESEEFDDGDDLGQEDEVGFQEARASVSDGFSQLRSLFATVNESTSVTQEYWDSYYVKFPEEAPPSSNNSSSNNGTYFNYNAQQWIDTYYNYSATRRLLLTRINGYVEELTRDWLDRVTMVNPDELYGLNMDLWYAADLTQSGHYYDALSHYESAVMGAIDAIENAPPPPPATVTIQAGGDDIPEDLFIEIYSGDCGDDCAEEDLVFVGEEGDSEIETSLESGEYTVVMISDGDVYSSEYLEVLSGGDITVLMSEGVPPVLDVMFHLQSLIIAALPAVVGFAGSRRYLEDKKSAEETTPLWIGAAIFVAVLYVLLG